MLRSGGVVASGKGGARAKMIVSTEIQLRASEASWGTLPVPKILLLSEHYSTGRGCMRLTRAPAYYKKG